MDTRSSLEGDTRPRIAAVLCAEESRLEGIRKCAAKAFARAPDARAARRDVRRSEKEGEARARGLRLQRA